MSVSSSFIVPASLCSIFHVAFRFFLPVLLRGSLLAYQIPTEVLPYQRLEALFQYIKLTITFLRTLYLYADAYIC